MKNNEISVKYMILEYGSGISKYFVSSVHISECIFPKNSEKYYLVGELDLIKSTLGLNLIGAGLFEEGIVGRTCPKVPLPIDCDESLRSKFVFFVIPG